MSDNLHEKCPDSATVRNWMTSPRRGNESELIKWIQVAVLPVSRVALGVTDTGEWVRVDGATVELGSDPTPITFLPCLETPRQDVANLLEAGLTNLGISPDGVSVFPWERVIRSGLNSQSERWIEHAMQYLQGGESGLEFLTELDRLSSNAPTQHLRHLARSTYFKATKPNDRT